MGAVLLFTAVGVPLVWMGNEFGEFNSEEDYTVTLPCTLWFLDKGKTDTTRKNKVLFIDARHIYNQIDRAHREFAPEQIEFISNIVRLYRGEAVETVYDSPLLKENFPEGQYIDVAGLCCIATIDKIKEQGWSLNPGRYICRGCRKGRGRF